MQVAMDMCGDKIVNVHVKSLLLLFDFDETWNGFVIAQHNISQKSVRLISSCSRGTDGQTVLF
jgi:hypothetical protein